MSSKKFSKLPVVSHKKKPIQLRKLRYCSEFAFTEKGKRKSSNGLNKLTDQSNQIELLSLKTDSAINFLLLKINIDLLLFSKEIYKATEIPRVLERQ